MPVQVNPLYGDTGAGVSRFGVAGDLRRMYSVGAAGGCFTAERLGQNIQNGSAYSYYTGPATAVAKTSVLGSRNMISNGSALFNIGAPLATGNVIANRLGVTGSTGGNTVTIADLYGQIVTTDPPASIQRTLLWGGEAIYQDGNATAGTIGAAVEAFVTNVAGTVTVASGSGSVQGNGTTFTTASLAGAYAYTPSKVLLRPNDLILITLDSGSKSLHRISLVNAASGAGALTVTPVLPGAATAKAYVLYRSGYGFQNSRVVSIHDGSLNYYNYYVGGHNGAAIPNGTIQCFTHPYGGGTHAHFMAPQTSAAADIQATDIAYYKGYLLYGFMGAIGWSVAGFPTSFTTGFGGTDFPAGNITVVNNQDTFLGFEYLGDELIAIFQNSVWQVVPTGTVPEFNFFRLPEENGVVSPPLWQRRPYTSGHNAVFYWAPSGVYELSGSGSKRISDDIWSALAETFSVSPGPNLFYDSFLNALIVTKQTGSPTFTSISFMYQLDTGTWSYVDPTTIEPTIAKCVAFSPRIVTNANQPTSGFYDTDSEKLIIWAPGTGVPWNPVSGTVDCTWATPIINLGDEYDGFPMAGFQLDAMFANGSITCVWVLYAGDTPYNLEVIDTGTLTSTTNRKLQGTKVDRAFMALTFTFQGTGSGVVVNGANIYPEGRGK